MKFVDPRFPMTISDKAINALTENPFKFPRPENIKGKLVTGEAENRVTKPNISFVVAMSYLYQECAKHMIKKFRENMVGTFEKLVQHSTEDYNLATFKCGLVQVTRSVYLYPWDIQCTIIPANPNLLVEDIDLLLSEMRTADIIEVEINKSFYLEIVSASLKYRVPNQTLQVKGNALKTQRTKA